jgi:hypothetical protein
MTKSLTATTIDLGAAGAHGQRGPMRAQSGDLNGAYRGRHGGRIEPFWQAAISVCRSVAGRLWARLLASTCCQP